MVVSPKRPDAIAPPTPDRVRLHGLVGSRFDASRLHRLRNQEEYHLLWPFQEHCPAGRDSGRPQPHPEITRGDWQGEFIGTWVATAAVTAWHSGDEVLRQKLDDLVTDWLRTQQEDGYLGTYDEPDRWKSWDVWVQAHDLIGLLTYYAASGSEIALHAATRVADRVLQDFGPGKRFLHTTGPHGGMASSAILEPMIWLYWQTGDDRYLAFCRWLVAEDWEAEGGPRIRSSLLAGRGVAHVANAKAAEMLIDFTGMTELYRATGDEQCLRPVLLGWQDLVQHHLYLTGSASAGEHFQPNYLLRNDGQYRLGETCVTMTWFYLNLSLGRLTGEARFFDMAEQALYNHLLAAQSSDGRGWAYYLGLRDSKRYRWHTDPDCCPSRGARALAQVPQHVFGVDDAGVVVSFYEPAEATLSLRGEASVRVSLTGTYPFDGQVQLRLHPEEALRFSVRLRVPGWCKGYQLRVNGSAEARQPDDRGYLALERTWAPGDVVELDLDMPVRAVTDALGNVGRVALMRGPLVYAADASYLRDGLLLDDVVLALDRADPARGVRVVATESNGAPHLVVPTVVPVPNRGAGAWGDSGRYYHLAPERGSTSAEEAVLVPFFDAGNRDPDCYRDGVSSNVEAATKVTYQVWLPFLHRDG